MDNDYTLAESIADAAEYAASTHGAGRGAQDAGRGQKARIIDASGHAGYASDGHALVGRAAGKGRGAATTAEFNGNGSAYSGAVSDSVTVFYRGADANGNPIYSLDRDCDEDADADRDAYGWRDR